MENAYASRSRETIIELKPGESLVWRLPPCTGGAINVEVFLTRAQAPTAPPGAGPQPTQPTGVGGRLGTVARNFDRLPIAVEGRTIARDSRPPRWNGSHMPDGGTFEPVEDSGPAIEVTIEVLRAGAVVGTKRAQLLHEMQSSGDVWAVKLTRDNDHTTAARSYRVHVVYPSVLPVVTRRAPAGFFERGFIENWVKHPYVQNLRLTEHALGYNFEPNFAKEYGHATGDQYTSLPDFVKFPEMKLDDIRLIVGGGPSPIPDPAGITLPDVPYLEIQIDIKAYGSRVVAANVPAGDHFSVTLPEKISSSIRLHLKAEGPWLCADVRVTSQLLDALDRDIHYPGGSINPKTKLTELIEDQVHKLLHPNNEKIVTYLDHYAAPYLWGRHELIGLGWDPATRDILIKYVGRQKAPIAGTHGSLEAAVEANAGGTVWVPDGIPRLFETADEYPPAPIPPPRVEDRQPSAALSKIEHIVVLMQENRSFDQVLGYLSRDGMLPREHLLTGSSSAVREPVHSDIDGLLPGENPRDVNPHPHPDGKKYRSTRTSVTSWPDGIESPWHGHGAVEKQIANKMTHFVSEFAEHLVEVKEEHLQLIMNYFTDAELPAYGALTREFAICERWHCSHIGGTLPNRFISLTGDYADNVHGNPEVNNPTLTSFTPLETPTFFDHLTANNVDWKLFEHGYGTLRLFWNYTFDDTNIVGFNDRENGFVKLALAGRLPKVTFIEPDYIEAPPGNDDHAPADMKDGQVLVAKIMSALLASPQWDKTLFIITYDEHGGFYDHAALPTETTTTAADGTVTRTPIPPLSGGETRLGVRVPAFVISPYVPKAADGKVNSSKIVFDHTSIPATILRRFCGGRVPWMGDRMSAIADVGELLTETARPKSDFATLASEMTAIENRPVTRTIKPPPPRHLLKSDNVENDFHNLVAFASAITGRGA